MTDQDIKERSIIVDGNGDLKIVGKWQIAELLSLSKSLSDIATTSEVHFVPQPAPAQQ